MVYELGLQVSERKEQVDQLMQAVLKEAFKGAGKDGATCVSRGRRKMGDMRVARTRRKK